MPASSDGEPDRLRHDPQWDLAQAALPPEDAPSLPYRARRRRRPGARFERRAWIWAGSSGTTEPGLARADLADLGVAHQGSVTVLSVAGHLTTATRARVVDTAIPLIVAAEQFVLDLTGVDAVDSLGVAAVYELRGVLMDRDRDLVIVPSLSVRVSLQLATRLEIVVLHDSVDQAVRAVTSR